MSFFRFSARQAFQGLWRNRVMNIAATVTMVLMLLLLSALVILISGVEAGLSFIESKVEVRAELHDAVADYRVADLQARLEDLAEVTGTVYVSKTGALEDFLARREADGLPDLREIYLNNNPLPARISVTLADPRESRAVTRLLEGEGDLVRRVINQQAGIDRLVNLTSLLGTIGLALMLFVGLTVLLIVVNTIRMALMSRAQEIEIMRLVGASDRYVRWPFIFEGVLVGLVGAGFTLLILLAASPAISDLAREIAGQVTLFFDPLLSLQITALVLLAGIGFGGLGAWISVRAYLHH